MNLTIKQRDDIKRNFQSLIPEVELSFDTYNKNNTEDTGISFKFDSRGGPVIYISDYPELVSEEINSTYFKVLDIVQKNPTVPFDLSTLTPSYCIENVVLQTVNKNNPIFKTAYQACTMNDYAGLLRIEVYLENGDAGTIAISERFIENLGLNADELLIKAIEKIISEVRIESIDSLLFGMNNDFSFGDINMYVATTRDMMYGASVLFAPDVFIDLANRLESDLFILPSSTHEVIVIPAIKEEMSVDSLKEMVTQINQTEVEITDKLTDNVYFYSRSENKITIA